MHKDVIEDDMGLTSGNSTKKQLLNYGALIYLTYQEEDRDNELFYACAEGFTKPKIRLRLKDEMAQESYSTGLFKIYPSFYNNEYLKTKKKYDGQKTGKNFNDLTNFEKRELRSELPKQLKTMEEECALNFEQYEKLKGTPIRYGQAIQLMHHNSHKFLVYDLNHVSDYETDNLKISLKTEYSEESCFRILPCYSYQHESQGNIYDDDTVHIVSMLDHSKKMISEPYLHASKSKEVEKDVKGQKKKIQKKELNISTEKKSPWKIQIFSDYFDEKKGYLLICDIVWINFSEKELNLIVQKNAEDKDANSCYFKFVNIGKTEKYSNFIGNSNGMFMVESEDMRKGGLVRWDRNYRLRHLTSNLYLTLGETPSWETEEIKTDEITKVMKLVEDYDDAALFRFDCIHSTLSSKNLRNLMQFLQKDSYFRLSTTTMRNQKEETYWLKTEEISSEALLNKDQETDTLIVPIFSTQKKQENIFKLAKSSQNEAKTTSFLISCMKTIVNTFDFLSPEFLEKNLEKFHSKYKSFLIRMSRLEKCLYDLTQFCHNKFLPFLIPDQSYGSINPLIQNTLREQSFIEVLVKLLILAFPKVNYLHELRNLARAKSIEGGRKNAIMHAFTMQKNEREINDALQEEFLSKKKTLCSSVYLLLKSICLRNDSNKVKIAKYLPIFSMQSFYIPNALECIIAIIENYENLLYNIHNEVAEPEDEAPVSLSMSPNQSTDMKKGGISPKQRNQSPSRILRDSKLRMTDFRMTKNSVNVTDFLKENVKKNQTYVDLYDNLISSWQEQEEGVRSTQWDLLNFFIMMIFQAELTLSDRRNLLRFLKTSVVLDGNGLNVNQELIFKYLNLSYTRTMNPIFKKMLYGIETVKSAIMITGDDGTSYKLEEAFAENKENNNMGAEGNVKIGDIANRLKLIPIMSSNSPVNSASPSKIMQRGKKKGKSVNLYTSAKYLCDQFDFYSMMLNGRNHTWKKFLEESIGFEAMIQYLDMDFAFEMKAKLCKLLMKLYIDQEPRRTQILPELCKVVHVSEQEVLGGNEDLANELFTAKEEQAIIQRIITTINGYIEKMKNETINIINKHNAFCGNKENVDIKDRLKDQQLIEYESYLKSGTLNIFNDFSLEILKLFQLLLRFGVYSISLNSKENQELFLNLRHLVMILEFDKTYPEARAFLDKRKEKAKESALNPKKLMENIFGAVANTKLLNMFDIFGAMKGDTEKKKIKKKVISDISNEQMSMTESFLRQNEILKQILTKMLSDIRDDIEYDIKLEICDIVEYYLDYKQDIMLSNLKNSFKQLVVSTKLYEKFSQNNLDYEDLAKIYDKFIETNIFMILPEIMKTGTSIDELDPKFKAKEKGNKDIEGLNLNNILDYEILPSLISLFCLTQNETMESKSLHIMSRLYNQREEFSKLTSNLLILFDDLNIAIFKMCKGQTKNLARNIDESEKWMNDLGFPENKKVLDETHKILAFLNSILFMGSTIIDEFKREVHVPPEAPIDPIRQDIMKHLKAYQIAISLIKDSIYLIGNDDNPFEDSLKQLFRMCFLFLTNFVRGNHVNQNILTEHFPVLLVNIKSDLGQVELFCEIFRNNKKICLEKNGEILVQMIDLIKTNGRQARYLEFLEIIQCVGEEEYLLVNQKTVLTLIFDAKNKQNMLYMKEAGNNKYAFDFEENHNHNNASYKDEPYKYHAKLIDVLSITAVGKEGLYTNERRLRSQINLKYALEILAFEDNLTKKVDSNQNQAKVNKLGNILGGGAKKAVRMDDKSGITFLKIPLLKFIYFIFLESEKISDEFNKYITEFLSYIDQETARLENLESFTPTFVEYLFEHLLRVLMSYMTIFWNDNVLDQKAEINTANSYASILKFAKALAEKIKHFNLDKSEHVKNASKFFSNFEDIKKDNITLFLDLEEDGASALKKKSPINDKSKHLKSKDEVWKHLWKLFIRQFLNSELLKKEIETEQTIFAKALSKSDEIFQKKPLLRELVNSNEIMKKLINILQRPFRTTQEKEDEETFIMTLQCLSNYIKISDAELNNDLDKDEKEEKKKEDMVQHQNFINQHNAVFMLFKRLSDYNPDKTNDEIFLPLINFGINLLDGGNVEVQKSIFYYFQNFTSSEKFFLRIHEKMNEEITKLKKVDEDQEEEEDDEDSPLKNDSDPMTSILRFLQLFAEGHNLDLQNYLRYQENNYHTYDIIQDIIELLNNYLLKKKEKHFNNMIQCFDTLTEYIQGPCYQNQVALIQGSFLDLASTLLEIDEIVDEIVTRKNFLKSQTEFMSVTTAKGQKSDKIPRWMIARLKYKCSITLISLLEARKDNDIVLRMFKSLSIDILKRNIIDSYIMFEKLYNGKYTKACFLHFQKDPQNKDEEGQESFSFILETGFNLFILYSNFIEAKPTNAEDNVNVEVVEDKGIFQIDLVNKIGKLGFSLLKDVTSTVTKQALNMKNLINKKNKEQMIKDMEAEIQANRLSSETKAMEFFQKNTLHIEVLREDKNIEKAYFYIPPFCHSLKDDEMTKNKFHLDVKRISVKAKVTFLLKKSSELIKIIKHEYYLRELFNKVKIISILANNIAVFRQVAFILAIVINLLVLFSYKYEDNLPTTRPQNSVTHNQITGLGSAVIFMSSIIVLYYLIKTAPLLIEKAWIGVKKDKLNLFAYVGRLIKTFIYLLSDFYVLYYLIYGMTAIVGTVYSPFFFAFHLFDVIVRFPVLLNVVKAVWIPKKSLALTMFLFIVLMYVFTLFGFYWLDKQYPEGFCDSMFICLITAWDKSFKNDGALGQFLNPVNPSVDNMTNTYVLKFFFDNIFNISLMVIMLNCILGIIIDNFGILREELKAYIYDKENFCFICGTSKEMLEKSSDVAHLGFVHHIKHDHNMWNYLFYIAYVREKEPTEYTGIESYVADQLERNEIQWFPYYRALCLKDDSAEMENKKAKENMERIKSDQENLKLMIKEINQQLDLIESHVSTRHTLKKSSMRTIY